MAEAGSFRVRLPEQAGPVTGRIYLLLSQVTDSEPRLQRVGWGSVQPFFGIDVDALENDAILFDRQGLGFPVRQLAEVAPGRYLAQGLLDRYELYRRADGHELWLPRLEWEGRVFTKTPGNHFSAPQLVDFDPAAQETFELVLDRTIPPVSMPADGEHVRRFRLESSLLSRFWGRPVRIGATVLLPRDFDAEPERRYPVVYLQDHFNLDAPFAFPEVASVSAAEVNETMLEAQAYHRALGHVETPEAFREAWLSDEFPRVLAVTFQHPNPWFDSSYAVNSANAGPYGDALVQELLPEVERRFRAIGEPWARVLTGGSTGGWAALALQLRHPELFGGVYSLFPGSVDFRRMLLSDIYRDGSMFCVQDEEDRARDHRFPSQEWGPAERPFRQSVEGQVQISFREMSRLEGTVASRCRSGVLLHAWQAIFVPVGEDGYPQPLWDEDTGTIDRQVAHYMRDHGYDLSAYLQQHWHQIGPHLIGKLHFFCGEMDNYYLNVPLYLLQDVLENAEPAYNGAFTYARPKQGHYTLPCRNSELVRRLEQQMRDRAPAGVDAA